MSVVAFLGSRASEDFTVTGWRPENWRQKILERFPNGDAPLTAILSVMGSEKTDDPHFHWFTRKMSTQSVSGTAGAFVYRNSDLSTAYAASSDVAAGTTVYVKMPVASVKEFRKGHQVLFRDASNYTNDLTGEVVGVLQNGASSWVAVKTLEADGTGDGDLSDCDNFLIIGSLHAEGAAIGTGVTYDPVEGSNYTQIFRNPLSMTRTAMQTRLRTPDQYKDAKKQAAQMHSVEMEKAFLWGRQSLTYDENGNPKRSTCGIIKAITTLASDNVVDYTRQTSAAYQGKKWTEAGKKWFDTTLEQVFRYGTKDKLCFCGSGALLGIQELAESTGMITLEPGTMEFGIEISTWRTVFGTLRLKTHPLFSYETTNRNSMLILEPEQIKYRYVQDTMYKSDKAWRDGGFSSVDALAEEYLTECGLEYGHMDGSAFLNGVGLDNTL